jgi:hypothetical protein
MIVFGVRANPKPNQVGNILDRQRSVMQADSNRPQASNLFEVQRRVM